MKKPLQVILLGIVFIIPLAILVFLNTFGDNRFSVPVYAISSGMFEECDQEMRESVPADLVEPGTPHVSIYLDHPDDQMTGEVQIAFERIDNALGQAIAFQPVSTDSTDLQYQRVVSAEQLIHELHCGYGSDTLSQFILTDSENRIRGYYGQDLKEVDRLIVEAKIVLENEQRDAKK